MIEINNEIFEENLRNLRERYLAILAKEKPTKKDIAQYLNDLDRYKKCLTKHSKVTPIQREQNLLQHDKNNKEWCKENREHHLKTMRDYHHKNKTQ